MSAIADRHAPEKWKYKEPQWQQKQRRQIFSPQHQKIRIWRRKQRLSSTTVVRWASSLEGFKLPLFHSVIQENQKVTPSSKIRSDCCEGQKNRTANQNLIHNRNRWIRLPPRARWPHTLNSTDPPTVSRRHFPGRYSSNAVELGRPTKSAKSPNAH